jgi:hypothetical protein
MSHILSDTTNDKIDTKDQGKPALVSLTEWAKAVDEEESQTSLTVLRTSTEPVYVSLFTDQGADVATHYLERTETWSGGYVYCLGAGCPACAAQIDRKRFVLLPVADLTDARIKILRVPSEKGPGKLLTEILKVLSLENRSEIVTKISRTKGFQYVVETPRQDALSPDVAAAIKRFVDQVAAKVIDLRSVVTSLSASEMSEHERIAKRLGLEGLGR